MAAWVGSAAAATVAAVTAADVWELAALGAAQAAVSSRANMIKTNLRFMLHSFLRKGLQLRLLLAVG